MQTLRELFGTRKTWPVATANAFVRSSEEYGWEAVAAITHGSSTGSNVEHVNESLVARGFTGSVVFPGASIGRDRYKHLIVVGVVRRP